MNTTKSNIINLLTYLIFIVLFKAYFIPEIIRQMFKIAVLIAIFLFFLNHLKCKELLNVSILFAISIVISGLGNYLMGKYTIKSLLASFLYALSFYDLYALFLYGNKIGKSSNIIKCLYRITFFYCILTVTSVAIIGIEDNSNFSRYLFGNKFTSSYLFLLLIALYGASHNMGKKRNIVRFYLMVSFSFMFSIYLRCSTATMSLTIIMLLFTFSIAYRAVCLKPAIALICLLGTTTIPVMLTRLLKIDFIYGIIFGLFDKSHTVFGRLEIYERYLFQMINAKPIIGYGYSNGQMLAISNGIFGNAQNGLLEQCMNFGLIGVVAILFTLYYCLKKSQNNMDVIYMSLAIYFMIVASIFEVTINWFFWLALFAVRWHSIENTKNDSERGV